MALFRICLPGFADFCREEEGQDLVEYTLLLGFLLLASAAIIGNASNSTATLWNDAKNFLSTAAVASGS